MTPVELLDHQQACEACRDPWFANPRPHLTFEAFNYGPEAMKHLLEWLNPKEAS